MPIFTYKNHSIHYFDEGEGFPLLFGHSFLCSAAIWQPQIEVLSKKYRCIAVDLPAHGASTDELPDRISDFVDLAEMHDALMQELGLSEYAIIGNSIGGMWGLHLANQKPRSVKAIVTIGSYLGSEPEENANKYRALFNAALEASQVVRPLAESLNQVFFSQYSFQHNPHLVEMHQDNLESIPKERILGLVRIAKMIIDRPNDLDMLKNIKVPCLITVGEADMARPPFESKRMVNLIPIADYVEIPNAGHLAAIENASYINEILQSYLDKVLNVHEEAA